MTGGHMTKHWKTILVAGAAVVIIGAGSIVALTAQGRGGPGGMHGGPGHRAFGPLAGLRHGMEALGLSDAQRQQIKAAVQQHRDEFKALADRGRATRKELRQAATSDPVDEAVIREKSAAVAAVHADLAVLGSRVRAEVFSLLTPEQQAKAKELRSQAEGRLEERRSRIREHLQDRMSR